MMMLLLCVPVNVMYAALFFLQIVCYCCIEIGVVYVCVMCRVLFGNFFIAA
jgi:hypothetical protein